MTPARPIEQLGFVPVVDATSELDVVDRRFPTHTIWLIVVMKLEEALRAAPPPIGGDEGAAAVVSLPHRAAHGGGNVSRSFRLARAPAGPVGGGELLPFQVRHEQVERAIEHLGQVSAGDGVAEQVLGAP
jgi:hypothetical protein